jgi:hypothetical protein
MELGWKRLLPFALAIVVVTAVGGVLLDPYIPGLFGAVRR